MAYDPFALCACGHDAQAHEAHLDPLHYSLGAILGSCQQCDYRWGVGPACAVFRQQTVTVSTAAFPVHLL